VIVKERVKAPWVTVALACTHSTTWPRLPINPATTTKSKPRPPPVPLDKILSNSAVSTTTSLNHTRSDPKKKKRKMGSASRAVSCLCCPCKCLACGLFSCLCSVLVSLLVAAGVLVLILYLLFRPHMVAATADSASLARLALSPTSALAYNLSVDITVRNPNKRVGLYYDAVEALALFDGQRFGYTPLPPFYQGTEDSTKVSPQFHGQEPLQGDVAAANLRQQLQDGKVAIDVQLHAKLRVKVWAFKVRGPNARITCPLSVPAPGSNNGAATFQPTDCKVWF
jgi:hypothetical protein